MVDENQSEKSEPRSSKGGRVPLWVSFGATVVVFALNVAIFGYALTQGLPHAHEVTVTVEVASEPPTKEQSPPPPETPEVSGEPDASDH